MDFKLKIYNRACFEPYIYFRRGETKLGQAIQIFSHADNFKADLDKCAKNGVRYAVLGIPEDVGIQANGGRKGAKDGWAAFIREFVNLQIHSFLNASKIMILGEIDLDDIQESADSIQNTPNYLKNLRNLTAQIDERVFPIIQAAAQAGLIPIVIGGGHNNAYPIIKGVETGLFQSGRISSRGIGSFNCDAHADLRVLEGRHSGNGFTYAHNNSHLTAYSVLGLHENYNSGQMLARLKKAGFHYTSYEDFSVRQTLSFKQAVEQGINYLKSKNLPVGLELDMDAIQNMPVSASTPFGLTSSQVFQWIHMAATCLNTHYFHICEGAPSLKPDGERIVGRMAAMCVITYIKAMETQNNEIDS